MSIDLNKLKISDLRKYTYTQTLQVVESLEESVWALSSSKVKTTDNFDDYIQMTGIIMDRNEKGDFEQDLKTPLKRSQFKTRLKRISVDLGVIGQVNNAAKSLEGISKGVLEDLSNVKDSLKNHKKELLGEIEKEKEDVAQLEHTTLAHVLSLMGIFSAVITIIMSVVLTATSWLNNADGASAIVGFAVPNLIALLSVLVLLSVVYIFVHRDVVVVHRFDKPIVIGNDDKSSQKDKKRAIRDKKKNLKNQKSRWPIFVALFLVLIIVVMSVASGFIALSYIKRENQPHRQYVISSSEYKVIDEIKSENEKEFYFVFELENQRYKIKYDKTYLHDGNLYFCKEHNALE